MWDTFYALIDVYHAGTQVLGSAVFNAITAILFPSGKKRVIPDFSVVFEAIAKVGHLTMDSMTLKHDCSIVSLDFERIKTWFSNTFHNFNITYSTLLNNLNLHLSQLGNSFTDFGTHFKT